MQPCQYISLLLLNSLEVIACVLWGLQKTDSPAPSLMDYCSPLVISVCKSDANQLSAVTNSRRERER